MAPLLRSENDCRASMHSRKKEYSKGRKGTLSSGSRVDDAIRLSDGRSFYTVSPVEERARQGLPNRRSNSSLLISGPKAGRVPCTPLAPKCYPKPVLTVHVCPWVVITHWNEPIYAAAWSATYFAIPPPFKSTQRVAGPRCTCTYSISLGGGGTCCNVDNVPSIPATSSSSSSPDLE